MNEDRCDQEGCDAELLQCEECGSAYCPEDDWSSEEYLCAECYDAQEDEDDDDVW